jgi:WD40 repeat protein
VIALYQDLRKSASATAGLFGLLCWNTEHDRLSWKQTAVQDKPRLLKLSPKGMFVTYVKELEERCVTLVDAGTGTERSLEYFKDKEVLAVCFSPDDRYLAVALSNNTIVCYGTSDGTVAWSMKVPGSPVRDLAWSKDGRTVASVGLDGYLRTFDANLRSMTSEVLLPLKSPIALRLSPDESWLYILDRDGSLIQMPCGTDSLHR